jgi:two-component system, chemotaxis family, CheB/CheR fusion protein
MSKKTMPAPKKKNKPPIVAIGASAGGVEAMMELLKHLPPDTGMCYVYVQHLDPTHESKLVEILGKVTKMKVLEAKDLVPLEANCLYIIPPAKGLSVTDGVITLNERKPRPALHLPIDQFFVSLAEKYKDGAIGIVLSGSASDGTAGLKAIKTAGGFTFAQDESAKFQSMPKSAVAAGVVDLVLSPKDIAAQLARIGKKPDIVKAVMHESFEDEISNTDEDLTGIILLLKKGTGVDFTHYKMNTIKRRIVRRMLLYKLESLKGYVQYLKQHPNELNVLYQDLLINVTYFFRDADAMEYMKKTLLPRILKTKSVNDPLRVWVPACATGEEAYSLAMVIMEVLGEKANSVSIQIFATDLSELAIARARLGIYSRHDVVGISPKRLQRFFIKVDGSYRIVKSIRDLCVFAPHNIFRDPPFSRLDIISCCNLMIYLDTVLQKKILATFHYALNNEGYLVLGKSETIGTSVQLFSQFEKKYKIYAKKKEVSARAIFEMNYRAPETDRSSPPTVNKVKNEEISNAQDVEKLLDNLLLTKYIPACVLVNYELDILLSRGSTGLFLELPTGRASLNLLKMARSGLAFELRNAIHKSARSGQPIKKAGIDIKHNERSLKVSIEITPIRTNSEEKLFLVVFEETPVIVAPPTGATISKDKLVKQLTDELNAVREDMRSIVEEQEASMEELQSANEEIVSSNEELQSINEELETSKEEVESTNEELMTINTELQVRNEQLAESYEYAEAVFSTIREAVIVLDKDLRVKTANKSFYRIFNTVEEDTEGVVIYELGNRQWNIPRLRELLEEVIPYNSQFHGFEVTHTFPVIGKKVMVLNARRIVQTSHFQQLILLAIEDITEHKKAEAIIAHREAWFRNMADYAPVMIWVAGVDKTRTFCNKTLLDFTGRTVEQETGNAWAETIFSEDLNGFIKTYNDSFDAKKPFEIEYRLRRHDGEYRWVKNTGKPTYSPEGAFTGYLGTCNEIHNHRLMNEALEERVRQRTHDLQHINHELEHSNEELKQFAYVASHDLQEPLRKIMTFSDRLLQLREEMPGDAKHFIQKMEESSQRMRRLIDDLLNFAGISRAGKKFVTIELNDVLKNALKDFDLAMGQTKATIHADQLPAIQGIPSQLQQLFHNLISNALKFSRAGVPPVIIITTRQLTTQEVNLYPRLQKKRVYHQIVFKDNGIGFEPEFAEQIFNIFQRLHDKQSFPGTGIGLTLCRKIVEYHGGIILAKSTGEGAEFIITVPEEQK